MMDFLLWIVILVLLFTLYIVSPILASYYLHKRLWMNDRLRTFLSVSLLVGGVGISVLVFVKLIS